MSDFKSYPRILETNGVPIHLYADPKEIEPQAMAQIRLLAESPIVVEYVSVMPDAHLGKGVTIGTVFASEEYVCPNAVGVDIGCGLAAVPIQGLYQHCLGHTEKLRIQQLLKERIPTGFNQHKTKLPTTNKMLEEITETYRPTDFVKRRLSSEKVQNQLGTLGGGNHFLEVVYEDQHGEVWILLHSGSRNIGNRVAQYYDGLARKFLEGQGIETKPLNGIHYMPIDSDEGQDYLKDMEWCQHYAFLNRQAMQQSMLRVMEEVTGHFPDMTRAINIHHNYCQCETCNGRKLYVTRKGATSATKGEMGIIPGSMGTGSYITRGKGNPQSWQSSSHGAGRRMSRTKAHANITQEGFEAAMEGIVCDLDPSVKDEAPQAYKDLESVMEQQESLVEIVHRLLPLVNVKGYGSKGKQWRHKKRSRKS